MSGKPIRDPVMTAAAANDPTIDQRLIQDLRAAAVHRRHHRRARRPDDDRRQEGRRADRAAGAEGARLGHPPGARDAASVGGRDHRPHQGEHSHAASRSRCRRASIRAPSSTRWAPRRCWATATCSICRRAPRCRRACTARSSATQEVHRVVEALKKCGAPNYIEDVLDRPEHADAGHLGRAAARAGGDDGRRAGSRCTTRP